MPACGDLRILFRAAAGPRRGFGHLVRCLSLARAMEVRPLLSVRGGPSVLDTALALGADVVPNRLRALTALRPDVVVIDDPIARSARRWIRAARRLGAIVVTIHDLGLGCPDGDVVIDGSVTRTARPRPWQGCRPRVALRGPRFAILNSPAARLDFGAVRRTSDRLESVVTNEKTVLVALGGGPRRATALRVARAIAAADPDARVRVAGGFGEAAETGIGRVQWVGPSRDGLQGELARADVAVIAGGVSMYEACASGVPIVGLPVVRAQVPTVRAFAEHGAVVAVPFRASGERTAAEVIALLDRPARRRRLARRSRTLIDGNGAQRAAAAVIAFVERHSR